MFAACFAVLVVEHYLPESFIGLPAWVLPIIRLVAIFALVLSIASALGTAFKNLKKVGGVLFAPFKKKAIRKKLLDLHCHEVIVLCLALSEGCRTILIKPDLAPVLSLQDKGLIQRFWSGVVSGDGTSSFDVPEDVWRILISMEEFAMPNAPAFKKAVRHGTGDEQILSTLPPKHPAVCSQLAAM